LAPMGLAAFDPAALQAICDVLADTSTGLTGSEIGRLLAQLGIADSVISTKRYRLCDALTQRQARDRSGNCVGAFIEAAMKPVRWSGRATEWAALSKALNESLAFVGLEIGKNGVLRLVDRRDELDLPPAARPPEAPAAPPDTRVRDQLEALERLQREFSELSAMPDRQLAGLAFERLLTRLFDLFELEPRGSFQVVGEQIDGSFVLDRETYLVEAKWTAERVSEADLLVLRGKIEGKSTFTRGLFVSVNGYSPEAIVGLGKGKSANFVMVDGSHLYRVLRGDWPLDSLLRRVLRLLAETGEPYVPVSTLVGLGL